MAPTRLCTACKSVEVGKRVKFCAECYRKRRNDRKRRKYQDAARKSKALLSVKHEETAELVCHRLAIKFLMGRA